MRSIEGGEGYQPPQQDLKLQVHASQGGRPVHAHRVPEVPSPEGDIIQGDIGLHQEEATLLFHAPKLVELATAYIHERGIKV